MSEQVSEELTAQVDGVYQEAFGQAFTVEQGRNGSGNETWFYIHPGVHKPDDGVFRDDVRRCDERRRVQPNCDLLLPGEAMVVWQNEKSRLSGSWPMAQILENRGGHARFHVYKNRTVRKLESRGVTLRGSLLNE